MQKIMTGSILRESRHLLHIRPNINAHEYRSKRRGDAEKDKCEVGWLPARFCPHSLSARIPRDGRPSRHCLAGNWRLFIDPSHFCQIRFFCPFLVAADDIGRKIGEQSEGIVVTGACN